MRPALAKYRVFVSHSNADAWIAQVISDKIELLGAETWLDENDLEGGAFLDDSIIKAIRSSDELLVLISHVSISSHWITLEIGVALG